MLSGIKDIQRLELKDTISQLNNTVSTQNELIDSLKKMVEANKSKEEEKDGLIANFQSQLDYLKTKLFGFTSEVRHDIIPGQFDLFHNETSDEKPTEIVEPKSIKLSGYRKERDPKPTYEEFFENFPAT
jgi:uncharacterized coiled-coil protein SlyX